MILASADRAQTFTHIADKAMRIFRMTAPEQHWSSPRYSIEGKRRWSLPGMACETCTTWTSAGAVYPAVELPKVPDKSRYVPTLKPVPNTPVRPTVLEELRCAIRHELPPRTPMLPGTRFGRIVGSAKGNLPDFSWARSWTLFLMRNAYERLTEAGVKGLLAVETEVIHRGKISKDLLEFQAEPLARVARVSLPPDWDSPCEVCGRRNISAPNRTVIEASSIPPDIDLVRGAEMTTWFFA